MLELTEKQQQIFDFIVNAYRNDGGIPTVREIMRAFGYSSTNAVNTHLEALTAKGYISRRPGVSRNIEIAPDYLTPERGVPIVGSVAGASANHSLMKKLKATAMNCYRMRILNQKHGGGL